MHDETYLATLAAMHKFTDRHPIASVPPSGRSRLASALWQHCSKERRFEGHQRHILTVSLIGDSHFEKLIEGRRVWRVYAPGTVVLLRQNEPTDWRIDGTLHMLHVYLDPDVVGNSQRLSGLSLPFRDPLLAQLGRATALALRETSGSSQFVVPLLEAIQQYFVDRFLEGHTTSSATSGSGLPPYIQRRIETFVQTNLPNKISASALAGVAGLSVGHLSRAFRDSYGVSPHQYIIDQRLSAATEMLTESTMSVEAISKRAGFVGASHFGAHFKKRFGRSPSQYRRSSG